MDHELAHLCERYWVEGGARRIMSYDPAITRMLCIRLLYLEGKADEVLQCPRRANLPQIPAKRVHQVIDKGGAVQPHIGVLERRFLPSKGRIQTGH